MSSEMNTPSKSHKHRHSDERTSSKKRKRDEKAHADSTGATPSSSKRRRRENETDPGEQERPSHREHEPSETVTTSAPEPTPEQSPFFTQTTSFYLPLAPIGLGQPLESLCAEHLSPLLLTYYPPLDGVVLSYQNARLSNRPSDAPADDGLVLAKSIDEYAVSYVWVIAEFTLLKPTTGIWIEGHVTVQSESHIGLVCWNLFNATIDRKRLPKKWQWAGQSNKGKKKKHSVDPDDLGTDDGVEGYFIDADGKRVEGALKFRVRDFENLTDFGKDRGFMSIEGTLLTKGEEEKAARVLLSNGGRDRSGQTPGRGRSQRVVEVS